MKFLMQEADTEEDIKHNSWDIGFIGNPLDDRGEAAINFVNKNCSIVHSLAYNSDELILKIDDKPWVVDRLFEFLNNYKNKRILLETTSLGFVEILLCCKNLKNSGISNLDLLYVEPTSYRNTKRSQLLHKRDFELSDEVPGYKAIPGFTIMLSDRYIQKGVFFLGYEERRLDRALEDFEMIRSDYTSVVFGVPAFKPGWEMDSFANNVRVLRDRSIRGGMHFCGAENPASVYEILDNINKGVAMGERLFIAPIGTKPNGIGVALFASNNNNIGIIYDHPIKTKKRSEQISKWHVYSITF